MATPISSRLGLTILPGSSRKEGERISIGGKWISSEGHPEIPQRGAGSRDARNMEGEIPPVPTEESPPYNDSQVSFAAGPDRIGKDKYIRLGGGKKQNFIDREKTRFL